jgi:hypothetical protein
MNGEIHDEKDYEELARLSTKLGFPVPQTFLNVQVTNPDGTVVTHYDGRSRTWTRMFWNFVIGIFGTVFPDGNYGAGSLARKSTAGTQSVQSYIGSYSVCSSSYQNGSYGIQVGSSAATEDFNHYALQAQITSGSAAGQLIYRDMPAPLTQYNAGTKAWKIIPIRVFFNNTENPVTVAEVGLTTMFSNENYLVCRDKLATAVIVPAGSTVTISYALTLNFPA